MLRLLIVAATIVTTSAFAQHFEIETKLLSPSEIEKVIGAYPKNGSVEEAEDFRILMHYQTVRTAKDCEFAAKDEEISVGHIFGGILSKYEVDKMTAFMFKAYANTGVNIYIAKKTFKRPRPYVANPAIKPCISLEDSYAYPSGHTMMARMYARILSEVYPERAEKFLARAAQFSENRVIGGVHHPSDIKSGNKLADYLATKMIQSEDFVHLMATH